MPVELFIDVRDCLGELTKRLTIRSIATPKWRRISSLAVTLSCRAMLTAATLDFKVQIDADKQRVD